ncbi:MAG: tetratricopeptide repeat protein [Planctomycetes bacterium]|nr:tetratricopeptide repeat protein [Planctomycetota bacterium]
MNDSLRPLPAAPVVEAEALIAAHRHREALAALDPGSGAPPAVRLARARALSGLERFRAAHELCQQVWRDPASSRSEGLHARVLGAQLLGRTSPFVDEALELAVDAAAEASRLAAAGGAEWREVAGTARLAAAHGLARKRCRSLAAQELLAAQQHLGEDGRALVAAGRLFLMFDERSLARERFAAAVAAGGSGRRQGLLGLGYVDFLAGDFAPAHGHLDVLLPLGPDDREVRRLRLRMFMAQGRWGDAQQLLEELLAGSPEADTALADRYELGAVLYRSGRRDEAVRVWQELATHHPADPVAQHARRHVGRVGRPEAASARRQRLAAFPSVAQLRDHCGPAAVELYLRFFGVPAEQLTIARAIKLPTGGTPVYRMRRFLEAAGFATRRIEADLSQLRALLDAGIPVILEEDYSQSRHVAVAIGYDDAQETLAVQDPMSHEVRETPYEELTRLRSLANNGALVAVPRAEEGRLDAVGAVECRYIALVDEAWAAKDAGSAEAGDRLVDEAVALRRDYEIAWLYRFVRAKEAADAAGPGESAARTRLRTVVGEIVQLWPDDEWPQQLVGEVLCAERRLDEALSAFEKARDRDPADARNWARIAECHLVAGRDDQAHAALVQTLRLDPAHPRANEWQAWQYFRLARPTLAWIANEVARELAPGNPFNHSIHATLLASRGLLDQALRAWTQAQQLAPGHLPFTVEKARLLARMGRVDEAVQALAGAARERPADPAIRVDLADLLYRHGRYEATVAVCQELRAIDAKHPSAHALGGAALCAIGKLDLGEAELRQALALRPTFTWALAELGFHLGRAGRHPEAIHACAAAFGLSGVPSHELGLAAQLLAAGVRDEAARRARNAAASGRLADDDWPRAAAILAGGAGLAAAHQVLSELATKGAAPAALLRAHARLLLERFWAPGLAREVLGRLAAVSPDDALVLAVQGAALMDGQPAGHAQGEQSLRAAMAKEPALAAPRRLLAMRLSTRGRFEEALAMLQACPNDFVDAEQRIVALLGLGRTADAEAVVAAIDGARAAGTESPVGVRMLRFRLAQHHGDWAAALALAEQVSREFREQDGDGRLDPWEEAKFECLLRLGERDRARRFGEQQAGDAASAARLARTALLRQAPDLAAHFTALALQKDPNEAFAKAVQAQLQQAAAGGQGVARSQG